VLDKAWHITDGGLLADTLRQLADEIETAAADAAEIRVDVTAVVARRERKR
jgi:hypothetical protein